MHHYQFIDQPQALKATIQSLIREECYALDTEFHREQTYFPKLALLQLAWGDQIALIDPLAVNLEPLAELMASDSVAVLHAARQDFEALQQACGELPRNFFDTQLAAGFLGYSTPSLALLHQQELGVTLAKASRMTDWLKRPLEDNQLQYAAADVAHLLEIYHRFNAQLRALNRQSWVETEIEEMRKQSNRCRDPNEAWTKIKEARQLKRQSLAVARSVAAWREQMAARLDRPPRYILPDLAVVSIAQSKPSTPQMLSHIRGVDPGMVKGSRGTQIIAAVKSGIASDWHPPHPPKRKVERKDHRSAVALATAWIHQVAKDERLDKTLLATRNDIEAFVREDPNSRLEHSWRSKLLGEPLRRLIRGEVALCCEQSSVVMEARSRQPLT